MKRKKRTKVGSEQERDREKEAAKVGRKLGSKHETTF
jgi:hypothetical protein